MSSGKMIPWNRRLGAIGEKAIEQRLLYFSNPMEPPIGIPIDFYCELSDAISPSSELFLVQAKGTQHFDEKWGRSIDKETVEFWLGQRYPVYIIVYDEIGGNFYWKSIQHQRKNLIDRLKTKSKTIYIKIDKSHILKKGRNENHEFIRQIKKDTDSINLIHGRPKFVYETYVRRLPTFHLSKGVVVRVRENIRTSINYLINHYLLEKDVKNAYFLCEFLTRFDKGHYDHFALFGQLNKIRRRKEKAKRSFEEAIRICKGDKNWNRLKAPSDPSIEDIIRMIKKEKDTLDC